MHCRLLRSQGALTFENLCQVSLHGAHGQMSAVQILKKKKKAPSTQSFCSKCTRVLTRECVVYWYAIQ